MHQVIISLQKINFKFIRFKFKINLEIPILADNAVNKLRCWLKRKLQKVKCYKIDP